MRNDYPGHPAGPLPAPPNPQEVLEVRNQAASLWMAGGLAALMVPMYPALAAMEHKIVATRAAAGQAARASGGLADFGLVMSVVGLLILARLYWVVQSRVPVIRIRPDGVEFPKDKLPPLRWDEIESVDIATLVLIGAGGARDYLGIKLKPGLLGPGASPYTSEIAKLARGLAGWDFDVTLFDLEVVPAHSAMQMRARLEASANGPLPLPPGLKPIPQGPLQERLTAHKAMQPRSKGRMGCGGLLMFSGGVGLLLSALVLTGMRPPQVPPGKTVEQALDLEMMMAGARFVSFLLGFFLWPWADDEDE